MSFVCAILAVAMLAHAVTATNWPDRNLPKYSVEATRTSKERAKKLRAKELARKFARSSTQVRGEGDDGPNTRFSKKRVALKEPSVKTQNLARRTHGDALEARY